MEPLDDNMRAILYRWLEEETWDISKTDVSDYTADAKERLGLFGYKAHKYESSSLSTFLQDYINKKCRDFVNGGSGIEPKDEWWRRGAPLPAAAIRIQKNAAKKADIKEKPRRKREAKRA